MNLTEHFTIAELTRSDYAIRHGISNQPTDADVLENLHTLAAGLERVRGVLRLPIHVSSGYRAPKVNSGVGGSKTSAHMRGLAADIILPGVNARDVCLKIQDAAAFIGFDQCIFEHDWTHISFPEPEDQPRMIAMTAVFRPGQPTTYLKGIA
jgi:zinc D-Ala-D-Ala carboxypeptidase